MNLKFFNRIFNIKTNYNQIVNPKDINYDLIKSKCNNNIQEYYTILFRIFYIEYKNTKRLFKIKSKNINKQSYENKNKQMNEDKKKQMSEKMSEDTIKNNKISYKLDKDFREKNEKNKKNEKQNEFNFEYSSSINKNLKTFNQNKSNFKIKSLKKIYNKIFLLTHPDKTDDSFKHYLFLKAKNSMKKKNLYILILISKILNIKINKYISNSLQKILTNEIFILNEKINYMKQFL